MRRPVISIGIMMILLAGSASAQYGYFGQNKVRDRELEWQILATEHFDVYFSPDSAGVVGGVAEMAEASAHRDPRFLFDRLRPEELKELTIEISILSPLERIADPLDFELGRHGIYLKQGGATGCFLPQVATETGWSKEEFLSQCAYSKAGLPPDGWKEPATEVYRFTCEIIEEG